MNSSASKIPLDDLLEFGHLLGKFGEIKRATLLPNGERESDSHHSFMLALVAYELAATHAPELDGKKILLYSLVHDLPEIITGDMPTLLASTTELKKKAKQDRLALAQLKDKLREHPMIFEALEAYELKNDDESLFVYWIDKIMTIITHFYDEGANLRKLGVRTQPDIRAWYDRLLKKLDQQGKRPHDIAVQALEAAYQKIHDELCAPVEEIKLRHPGLDPGSS